MDIRPVGIIVMHADKTKVIGAFRYLCQRAQKHTDKVHTFLHFFT